MVLAAQLLAQVVPAPVSIEAAAMPGSGGKILATLMKDICLGTSGRNFFQFEENPADRL